MYVCMIVCIYILSAYHLSIFIIINTIYLLSIYNLSPSFICLCANSIPRPET